MALGPGTSSRAGPERGLSRGLPCPPTSPRAQRGTSPGPRPVQPLRCDSILLFFPLSPDSWQPAPPTRPDPSSSSRRGLSATSRTLPPTPAALWASLHSTYNDPRSAPGSELATALGLGGLVAGLFFPVSLPHPGFNRKRHRHMIMSDAYANLVETVKVKASGLAAPPSPSREPGLFSVSAPGSAAFPSQPHNTLPPRSHRLRTTSPGSCPETPGSLAHARPLLLRPSTSLLRKAPVDPVTWNADHSLLTATPLALANGQREPIGQGSPPFTISQHTPTARRAKCRRHRGPRSTRNWPWGLSHSHRGPP